MNAKGDAKKLFNTVNGLTNRVKANPLPDGYMDQELADHFSNYLYNKIKTIRDKMQHIPNYTPPTRDVPKLSYFNELNKDVICTIMSKLGLKQCEQDTLPISIILQCEPIVQEHLLIIINTSLKSGHFPQTWKQVLVKPIIKNPKMGTPDKNYRPISNLKYFSKILECAALQQIVDHCEHNNLLPRNQSAYQKGYSCETMLVKLADCILNGMECQEISAVVACDLSAAFDTINISVLLPTFHNYYGITGDVLKWVESYLTDQSCSVMINGKSHHLNI